MSIKKLSPVENGLGVIIDQQVLDLLNITRDTPLELTTDGVSLIIRPIRDDLVKSRALDAAELLMDAHEDTFRKLAK